MSSSPDLGSHRESGCKPIHTFQEAPLNTAPSIWQSFRFLEAVVLSSLDLFFKLNTPTQPLNTGLSSGFLISSIQLVSQPQPALGKLPPLKREQFPQIHVMKKINDWDKICFNKMWKTHASLLTSLHFLWTHYELRHLCKKSVRLLF